MITVTGKIIKIFLPAAFILLFLGIVTFHYLPSVAAENYRSEIKSESKKLEQDLSDLSNTTQAQIFQAPDIPPAENLQDCAQIKDQIAATRKSVEQFSQKAQNLQAFDYPNFSDKYIRAKVTRSQSENISAQTQEILNNYQKLIEYLETINLARISFEAASDQINNSSDALPRAQTELITENLNNAAKQLKDSAPPTELLSTQQSFTTLLSQGKAGVEAFKAGRADSGILLIESSTKEYETNLQNDFYQLVVASHVLKDINTLPDRASSFSDL